VADEHVVDTSVLVATLRNEPGGDVLAKTDGTLLVSAVNFAETVTVLINNGLSAVNAIDAAKRLDLTIIDFDREQAIEAARLRPITRAFGLSLGDRACLALAGLRNLRVMTADRIWTDAAPHLTITVIR
jgi:PIN domain nuclease of toxin-antitoxin system